MPPVAADIVADLLELLLLSLQQLAECGHLLLELLLLLLRDLLGAHQVLDGLLALLVHVVGVLHCKRHVSLAGRQVRHQALEHLLAHEVLLPQHVNGDAHILALRVQVALFPLHVVQLGLQRAQLPHDDQRRLLRCLDALEGARVGLVPWPLQVVGLRPARVDGRRRRRRLPRPWRLRLRASVLVVAEVERDAAALGLDTLDLRSHRAHLGLHIIELRLHVLALVFQVLQLVTEHRQVTWLVRKRTEHALARHGGDRAAPTRGSPLRAAAAPLDASSSSLRVPPCAARRSVRRSAVRVRHNRPHVHPHTSHGRARRSRIWTPGARQRQQPPASPRL
mmetsp:Transcript_5699/g.20454  ORF Transcript_5699/g.20454 Transcript_5699/m.20454 type:complete len:336 (-) Transcript_5699:149-1156(-)